MPVRSSSSSVLRWPDRSAVERALRAWADEVVGQRDEGVALGVFGSFVSGGWGVGSDLDLVAVVSGASQPFPRRVTARDDRFADILRNHTRWLVDRRDTPAPA